MSSYLTAGMLHVGSEPTKSHENKKNPISPLIRKNSFLVLARVLDLINFHSNSDKIKKCIITFHDPNLPPIDVNLLGLSLGGGNIVVYNKNDINAQITGEAIHKIRGNIGVVYGQNGIEKISEIDAISLVTLERLVSIVPLESDLEKSEPKSSQKLKLV